MKQKAAIALVAVGIVAAGCATSDWAFRQFVPASFHFCLEGKFQTMPADDNKLMAWLGTQPGVVPHQVHVRRFEGGIVEVGFIQVTTLAHNPPLPDLDSKCAELGYKGPDGPFHDCENRYR